MATITFEYLDKCSAVDPHVRFSVKVGGTERLQITRNASDLLTFDADRADAEAVAELLLEATCREWLKANPAIDPRALTSPQLIALRDYIEAKVWEV